MHVDVLDSSVHAFAAWLDEDLTLTPTELRVLRVFGSRFGAWIPARALVRAVYRDTFQRDLLQCDINTIRTHIYRIRAKLHSTPWRIENRSPHGLYRLVHDIQ
jgi:DNA-binding response OmpR family regulator